MQRTKLIYNCSLINVIYTKPSLQYKCKSLRRTHCIHTLKYFSQKRKYQVHMSKKTISRFSYIFPAIFYKKYMTLKNGSIQEKKSHLSSENLLQVQLLPSDIDPKLAILQVIVFTQVVFPLCRFCNNYILYYKESFKWNVNPVNTALGTYFKCVYLHF